MGCILLVIIGLGGSLLAGDAGLQVLTPTLHLPTIGIPAWNAISEAAIGAFWPQLALTLANAVLLTSVLAADYFPSARPSATPLVSFGVNVAVGLACDLIIEPIRSAVSNLRQPTV